VVIKTKNGMVVKMAGYISNAALKFPSNNRKKER